MATRRDYTATAEVLRSTPMPAALRRALAERMAGAYAVTSTGFDAGKFVHESTRNGRAGEVPTVDTTGESSPAATTSATFSHR